MYDQSDSRARSGSDASDSRNAEARNRPAAAQPSGQSPDDSALLERIDKLEAQLAETLPNTDAHIGALYGGLRSLIAEVIWRRQQAEKMCGSLTQILEATSDAFVALDSDWRYTYVNARAGQMLDRDPASLIGKHIWTEFPEGVGQPFQLAYERAVAKQEPQQIEAYYPPYDRWFENRIFPYGSGGVAIFFQDVTERRLTEERLRESEQRYRSLFEHNPDAVYSFDPEGRFTSANAAFEALTGYRPDELLGRHFTFLTVPEHREVAIAHFRAAMAGSARSFEETIVQKSGRRVEIAITKLPIVVGGTVVGVFGIAKDLTAQRELEEQLRHAQRMEAVGRLAGGVAHDFNNLLTIIQSYATFLDAGVGENSALRADTQEILKAARRAAALTRQLLVFSRKQVLQLRLLDVNREVNTVAELLRRVIGEDITIETDLEPGAWPVLADPGQLEQVLMNLAVNARDAMPAGGTLRLRTANVTLDAPLAHARPGIGAGAYVSLMVEDTGTGIDPAVRSNLFEPFVTTKEPGVGTGLGLATVYSIVEQSRGAIDVESTPGEGTRFSVLLPRASGDAGTEGAPPVQSVPAGHETILLVEDDDSVRAITRRMLERQGYMVRAASDAAEALTILESSEEQIDLVITDVVLPGQNGRRLAEDIAERWPRMHVLFMSGYADDEILRRGMVDPNAPFLSKPFSPEPLARAVREALDRATP